MIGKSKCRIQKYRNKTYEQINIIVLKGSKERIVEAATTTGQSTNGFIRSSLNESVEKATGRPMEPVKEDNQNAITTGE